MRETRIKYWLIVIFVFGLYFSTSVTSGPKNAKLSPGIHQLIETRDKWGEACWGLIIQLDTLTFADTIRQDQLSIIEAKHSSECNSMMKWTVDKSHKKLTIKFKPGMGDFGSGNYVAVAINPSAFAVKPIQPIYYNISTDIQPSP